MCGGNTKAPLAVHQVYGLSPRVRGKLEQIIELLMAYRSIPACAGETAGAVFIGICGEVYPRVCGGNGYTVMGYFMGYGLSPRVRGKQIRLEKHKRVDRSIPACAGETLDDDDDTVRIWVYPRVCGGNKSLRRETVSFAGLSPRVRGKPPKGASMDQFERSIPACAGETSVHVFTPFLKGVYPRVCGGNRPPVVVYPKTSGLSPRVRGKQEGGEIVDRYLRSIPACAGETRPHPLASPLGQVYPRVCGGNAPERSKQAMNQGLSPRVRGKRYPNNKAHRV